MTATVYPSVFFLSLMNGAAWGGSEELWYKTALYLAQKGCGVGCAVYAWPQKNERLDALRRAGCQVITLPNRPQKSRHPVKRWWQKRRYQAAMAKAVAALPVTNYHTVIVNQGGYEVSTGTWQAFYQKLPRYALLFHNYNEGDRFSAARKKRLRQWITHAAINLFAAQKAKETLQQQLGITVPHAGVFINPITFAPPATTTPLPGLDTKIIFSVFAALDTSRKGQDALIKALALPQWKARQWQLNLYGDGPDKALLQQLIVANGLQDKIVLQGHTTNVVAALQHTHLVLQVSRVDAMPLAVLEAMAMSRPLVVSPVGDMPLWVKKENGWICRPQVNEIDSCLEKAWQAKEEWPQMGVAAYQIFRRSFPSSIEAAFLAQVVDNL